MASKPWPQLTHTVDPAGFSLRHAVQIFTGINLRACSSADSATNPI
jgi:hypothetical protein